MTNLDIAQQRLFNQHIAYPIFKRPAEIVKYMGAMQAQDYAGAKWAVGMRLQNSNDMAIDKAMADGSIIRTHVLRPTWHFISPDDARWMMDLTAPRINTLAASMFRQLQLDSAVFKKSNDALAKALEGGKCLDRTAMMATLNQAGIATDDLRFIHLLMKAELDKVICSGPRQGKQFTYALFDDRVPAGSDLHKEEALYQLANRYFISRGPATLADFTWWSGLSVTEAKAGLESIKSRLTGIKIDNQQYWLSPDQAELNGKVPIAHLLPAFDEFAVAYKDRTAAVNPKYLKEALHVIFNPSILVNNQVVGTWKRMVSKNSIDISLNLFGKLNKMQTAAVEAAQKRYIKFMNGA